MTLRSRWIAALMCAVVVLVMAVSAAYVVHEAACGHECAGENCPVCAFIAHLARLRRSLGAAIPALTLSIGLAAAFRCFRNAKAVAMIACGTLVSSKIRLND